MSNNTENKEHKEKMQDLNSEVKKQVAKATQDKGIILLLTGDGKGKSSSGLGMVLRALGHEMRVGVVQFIKGKWQTGEQKFLEKHPNVQYFAMGDGFTWETQDRQADIARAITCWEKAETMLSDEETKLVLLDELNVVLSFGYLQIEKVISALLLKPKNMHVVITGREACEELVRIADTVSEVTSPKHAFDSGVRAQKGIEF